MSQSNKAVTLASRPVGPVTEDNFKIEQVPYPQISDPKTEVIVRLLQCSVDPYMRGRMSEKKSYIPPFELNKPIQGYAIVQVVECDDEQNVKYKKGELISGILPFQEYTLINVNHAPLAGLYTPHKTLVNGELPLSYGLSALGMPGITAWIGLNHLCEPKKGENVLVTAAGGAVGSMVGQLAKIQGCYVVGVAGSDEKVNHIVQELKFDAGFNYKTTSYAQGIEKHLPNGVDVYFDNVGGDALDQALIHMNKFGRIALCGAISQYNDTTVALGPRLTWLMIGKAIKMQGFIVGFYPELWPVAADAMAGYLLSGELKIDETVYNGIENVPKAFIGLMAGENKGKMIVKVSEKN